MSVERDLRAVAATIENRLIAIDQRLTGIEALLNAQPQSRETATPGDDDIVWPNGRRPRFWHDIEVRRAAMARHRNMTIAEAHIELLAQFGPARAPSASGIHRLWQKMDVKRGRARS